MITISVIGWIRASGRILRHCKLRRQTERGEKTKITINNFIFILCIRLFKGKVLPGRGAHEGLLMST